MKNDKRQLGLGLLDDSKAPASIPAGFFIHFGEEHRVGRAAVDKHLE